jgi:hypothetical protein
MQVAILDPETVTCIFPSHCMLVEANYVLWIGSASSSWQFYVTYLEHAVLLDNLINWCNESRLMEISVQNE